VSSAAGRLADADHLRHHRRKHFRVLSGTENRFAALDALAGHHHRILDDRVAGVLAVISRPSRIGTPELISVDSVRQNRATAIFRMMLPRIGAFSTPPSTTRRPLSVRKYCLKP